MVAVPGAREASVILGVASPMDVRDNAAPSTRAGTASPLPLEWASGMSRLAAHAAPQSSCSPSGAQAALICCPLGVSSARTEGVVGVLPPRRFEKAEAALGG